MRKVIDTNCLRSPELDSFLGSSTQNYAVLTDYSAIEAYKGNSIVAISESMRILSKYPKQVIVLKGTSTCCGFISSPGNYPDILIDKDQTGGFEQFCLSVEQAIMGNPLIRKDIESKGVEARYQIERMKADTEKMMVGLIGLADTYTPQDHREIRDGNFFEKSEIIDKFMRNTMLLAQEFFTTHPHTRGKTLPTYKELSSNFIFRVSLCMELLLLKWIQVGKPVQTKPEKLVNDQVDVNFAAFALYFDDLLTNDKRLKAIYEDAKILVQVMEMTLADSVAPS